MRQPVSAGAAAVVRRADISERRGSRPGEWAAMSAPCESAASTSPCACTNISLMQLFHELKQKFPAVPDHVVSSTIELYCHDKNACEIHLHSEAKASLAHAYHASSSAAARQLSEIRVPTPVKCPNQPIIKHEVSNATAVKAVECQGPQTAILSSAVTTDTPEAKIQVTDANQNVVDSKSHDKNLSENNNISSPVTINIDKCIAKYHYTSDSPSDLELTNEGQELKENSISPLPHGSKTTEDPETNYRIHKSNKIKFNLHEKLEKSKEKRTIKKETEKETQTQKEDIEKETIKKEDSEKETTPQPLPSPQNVDKPKRPNTLEFIKPNPDIAFKPSLKPEAEPQKSISPVPPKQETTPGGSYWPDRGYPLNLSVNVNCHMDYGRGYDPWLQEYDSPRAITSVNLTVCTPTSNMASPIRDEDVGFEGHVTVTVSPSSARAPRRRAPPPPPPGLVESPRNAARFPAEPTLDRSLIERQKERLGRLAAAIAQERGRLAQLTRETQILAAPAPAPAASRKLQEYVHHLRDQCDTLAKRLELGGNEPDAADFYSNIYTGQRGTLRAAPPAPAPAPAPPPARPAPPPPPEQSWQCHVCTFRNHPLLDKCEECEMPRILVVRAHDGITVRLVPGRRKFVRSWVL